ncbi:hypothetical protein BT93_H3669 [Corymbia citriodora subsp. variegata]|nr:hypothetical protein BT93_H3669 [Corymbia citriodora subsp. variegata]
MTNVIVCGDEMKAVAYCEEERDFGYMLFEVFGAGYASTMLGHEIESCHLVGRAGRLPLNRRSHRRIGIPSAAAAAAVVVGASLVSLIRHHHHQSVVLRDRAEKAKRDAIRSAAAVSDLLVEVVNGGVEEAFINQKRIELEIRALAATASRFMKQTDHWLASTHAINSAIKEIGDFENWMKIMDFDCKSINAAIRNIHQA